jgi:hypothetical protein
MTEISAARTRLYDALVAGGGLNGWRVHHTTPPSIVAPTIYLDSVELGYESLESGQFINATFPVVVVADGADHRQIEQLDDLIAYVWDAASTVGDPTESRPISLDVGGPTLRAQQMRVGMFITARTLCPPSLATVGA